MHIVIYSNPQQVNKIDRVEFKNILVGFYQFSIFFGYVYITSIFSEYYCHYEEIIAVRLGG